MNAKLTLVSLLCKNSKLNYEIMPNYKALLEEHPSFYTILTATDEKMYSFGRKLNGDDTGGIWRPGINQTWLDNLNLSSPETIDEFIDVMRQFKATDPSTFGVDEIIPMGGSILSVFSISQISGC